MVDDQFDARPQSGLSPADVVWQAPAEGGIPRYMAFFQTGDPAGRRTGPQLAPVLHRLGVRMEAAVRARRRLAAGEGAPRVVEGPRLLRLQRRRVPLGRAGYLWRIHTRSAPHNVYTDGKHLRGWRAVGAKPGPGQKPAWNFADPRRSSSGRGRHVVVPYLENKVSYKYDRVSNTYRRSVTGEKKQTDAGTKDPDRADQRDHHGGPASRRSTTAATISRLEAQVDGQRQGLDLDQRQDDPRDVEEEEVLRAKTRFFDKNGNTVTLTRGQTFVQVVPRGAKITTRKARRRVAATGDPSGRSAGHRGHPHDRVAPDPPRGRRSEDRRGSRDLRPYARVSRARRPPTSGDRAPARQRRRDQAACSPSSVQTARIAVGEPAGSPGSTRMPAAPTISGSAPTALATTGTPAAIASSAATPRRLRANGLDRTRAPATSAASRSSGRRGAYAIESGTPARAAARDAARSPGVAPTRHTRGGQMRLGRTDGRRRLLGERRERGEQRGRSWRAS